MIKYLLVLLLGLSSYSHTANSDLIYLLDLIDLRLYETAKQEIYDFVDDYEVVDKKVACEEMMSFLWVRYLIAIEENCKEDIDVCIHQMKALLEQISIQRKSSNS